VLGMRQQIFLQHSCELYLHSANECTSTRPRTNERVFSGRIAGNISERVYWYSQNSHWVASEIELNKL